MLNVSNHQFGPQMLSFIRSFVKVSDNFSSFPLIHFTIKLSKFIALLFVKAKISSINSFGTQPICSVNESVHVNTLIPIIPLPDLSVTFARRKISFSLLPSPSKSLIAFRQKRRRQNDLLCHVTRNSKNSLGKNCLDLALVHLHIRPLALLIPNKTKSEWLP